MERDNLQKRLSACEVDRRDAQIQLEICNAERNDSTRQEVSEIDRLDMRAQLAACVVERNEVQARLEACKAELEDWQAKVSGLAERIAKVSVILLSNFACTVS